jgi:hypothetical protein
MILRNDGWFYDLGQPVANRERYINPIPLTISYFEHVTYPIVSDWSAGVGIDSVGIVCGSTISVADSNSCMKPVFSGNRESYGYTFDEISDAVYDSFAVSILSGEWYSGKLTLIPLTGIFLADYWYSFFHFDNAQFARQLFATNTRADTAWLNMENDTLAVCHLEGEYTPFDADSSQWTFEHFGVGRVWEFKGWQLGASLTEDGIQAVVHSIYSSPDTFEVCLHLLPDSTGETVLRYGAMCKKMWLNAENIEEQPTTPDNLAIYAHPNPFNSAIQIDAPINSTIKIYDVKGNLIANPDQNIWAPEQNIQSGIYIVNINNDNGINEQIRVVYLK